MPKITIHVSDLQNVSSIALKKHLCSGDECVIKPVSVGFVLSILKTRVHTVISIGTRMQERISATHLHLCSQWNEY